MGLTVILILQYSQKAKGLLFLTSLALLALVSLISYGVHSLHLGMSGDPAESPAFLIFIFGTLICVILTAGYAIAASRDDDA